MQSDPDDRATGEAAAALTKIMAARGHHMTKAEAFSATFNTVVAWIQARTHHWAVRRGTPPIGQPDAMTMGFVEAALPLIADKASDLPWSEPIGQWAKADAVRLFAFAHEVIEAVRVNTLEDPTDHLDVGAAS